MKNKVKNILKNDFGIKWEKWMNDEFTSIEWAYPDSYSLANSIYETSESLKSEAIELRELFINRQNTKETK